MKYLKVLVVMLTILTISLTINNVYAHPGRTDSSGCHYCRTNCAKWGLSEGEYHCHNGSSSSSSKSNSSSKSSSSINSSNKTTQVIKIEKSSNAKLKKLLIENKEISLKQNMYYETDNDMASIEAIPESGKAKVEIDKTGLLEHGSNKIKITVTAEDKTKNTYNLNIVLKSSDADISTIKINDENVDVYKTNNIIEYETSKETVNIEVIPSSQYAKVYYEEQLTLKDGNNKSTIKVVAENGKEKEYTLNIKKTDDASIIGVLIFIIIIGGIIYLIYKNSSKKTKSKFNREKAYCIKCGKQITTSDTFCIYCGYNQKNKQQ